MQAMLNIAVRAARAAGNIITRNIDRLDRIAINQKSQANDFVSEVDQMAEAEIIKIIKRAYPDHSILAEESGNNNKDSDYQWIIDPLDGTTNFLHGFGHYAVSIALRHQKDLLLGVIYDPTRDELFTAERGGGALLNNRKLRVAGTRQLNSCLIGTGFPFSRPEVTDNYLKTVKPIMDKTAGIRRAGAAALDLAYVAAGRLDGFWEYNLKPWDIAAGILLIQEAGGIVTEINGGNSYINSGNILAANPYIHKLMLQIFDNLN